MELKKLTIKKISAGLRSKKFSALELAKDYLRAIEQDRFNCFISVNPELTLASAAAADQELAKGSGSLLTGVPVAVKDVIMTKGWRTTAGSKILQNYEAAYSATAVERLLAQQAVILGKTNCDEFAMGSSTEHSAYGNVLNPHDPTRVPGGSSGGSAAAVAANLAPVALGTDTGGSIRQPAAFCGVVGIKPTYGRVSRYGLIAMSSSLDQIGPFGTTVEDCALLLSALSGLDEQDSTSSQEPVADYVKAAVQPLKKGLTIGLPRQFFPEVLDERLRKLIEQGLEKLKKQGVTVKEVDLPYSDYALAAYYIIMPAEVSSNLARFDGLRYGFSLEDKSLDKQYRQTRSQGFGAEVRRRILLGTYALSAGYYDAFYLQAQKVRTLIKQDYDKVFREVDLLVTPTTPSVAFKLGEKSDPLSMYLADIFTVSANITGLPAISLPNGQIDGLPAAVQIIGPAWQEAKILNLAYHWERMYN